MIDQWQNRLSSMLAEWQAVSGDEEKALNSIYASMLTEWKSICEHHIAEEISELGGGEEVAAWVPQFEAMLDEQRRLMSAGQWVSGPVDLLSIIGRPRQEVYHSAILRWLLDPSMPHGLGASLLMRLLVSCFPGVTFTDEGLRVGVAECEVPKARSRADIVFTSSEITLVIEVKVNARERENQCDDLYSDYYDKPRPYFVFLTPDGKKPVSATGEACKEFATLSFRRIHDDLWDLVNNGQNDEPSEGLHTIYTYLSTLRKEFL